MKRDQLDDYFSAVETDRRAKLEDINLRDRSTYFYQVFWNMNKILPDSPNMMDTERIKSIIASRGFSIINRAATFQ